MECKTLFLCFGFDVTWSHWTAACPTLRNEITSNHTYQFNLTCQHCDCQIDLATLLSLIISLASWSNHSHHHHSMLHDAHKLFHTLFTIEIELKRQIVNQEKKSSHCVWRAVNSGIHNECCKCVGYTIQVDAAGQGEYFSPQNQQMSGSIINKIFLVKLKNERKEIVNGVLIPVGRCRLWKQEIYKIEHHVLSTQ